MRTPKEILTAIKAIFTEMPPVTTVEPAPAPVEPVALESKEYSLADGTKVMIDKLEVGGIVTINDLPAPEGYHILADGSKIKVDAAGVIIELEAAEPAIAPVAPVAPVEPALPLAPVAMRDERVDALQAELKSIKVGFLQLVELVESLTNEPAVNSIEPQKGQFGEAKASRNERLAKFQNVLTQIKNK